METSSYGCGDEGANLLPLQAERTSVVPSQGKRVSERSEDTKHEIHTDDEKLYDDLMNSVSKELPVTDSSLVIKSPDPKRLKASLLGEEPEQIVAEQQKEESDLRVPLGNGGQPLQSQLVPVPQQECSIEEFESDLDEIVAGTVGAIPLPAHTAGSMGAIPRGPHVDDDQVVGHTDNDFPIFPDESVSQVGTNVSSM